jgi:hypothetical protein
MCRHFSFRPDSAIATRCAVHALLAVLLCCASTVAHSSTPVPQIANPLVPMTVKPGSAAFSLTVNGTGFVAGSTVYWNGNLRATTFVSNSQLIVAIPASDVASATSGSVTVHNPGGTMSNAVLLLVTTPVATPWFGAAEIPQAATQVSLYWGLFAGDFDGDGFPDVAVNQSANLQILRGNGDGTFQYPVNYPIPGSTEAWNAVVGDFNNDGTLDFSVSSFNTAAMSVFLSNPDGTVQPALQNSFGTYFYGAASGDFDSNGKLDIVYPDWWDSIPGVGLLLGNGDGTFFGPVSLLLPLYAYSVAVADFNRDGIPDIAASTANAYGDNPQLSILMGNGNATFAQHVDYPMSTVGYFMQAADLNGDGYPDIVAVKIDPGTIYVFLNNGDGTFAPPVEYSGNSDIDQFTSEVVGDFNGDGKLDVAAYNTYYCGNNCVEIFAGNGDGTFQPPTLVGIRQDHAGDYPGDMAIGDFNLDGKLDIATPTSDGPYVLIQTPAPSPTVVPGTVSFGPQAVGTISQPFNVGLLQPGSSNITFNNVTVTGDFQIYESVTPCIVLVSHSCNFELTFQPAATGTRTGTAAIFSTGGIQYMSLVGTGVTGTAGVTIAPSSLNFATQLVKTLSPYQSVVITNTGTGTLNLTSTTLIGPAAGDFVLINGNCGATIAPGSSCIVEVGFKPTVRGVRTASLSVVDNASNSPQTVALSGVGTSNSLSASSLNFGSVTVGTSSSRTVTLTNVGGKATAISSVGVMGFDKADFSQTNDCGSSLAAGASCTFEVTFMPAVTGSLKASLAFTSNGAGRNAVTTVGLAGTGK